MLGQETDTPGGSRRPNAFELYSPTAEVVKACKAESDGRLAEGQHQTYRVAAPSREEMHAWISAIQAKKFTEILITIMFLLLRN